MVEEIIKESKYPRILEDSEYFLGIAEYNLAMEYLYVKDGNETEG